MQWKMRRKKAIETRKVRQYGMGAAFIALLAAGWYFPLVGYFIPLCMIAGIGMAITRGRKWCDWYCPRGSFVDKFLEAISPGREIPGFFKSNVFRTVVITFLMAMLTFQIIRLWPDGYAIGRFFMVLLTVTTTIGIILAVIFHQRSWCYICPIGSLSNWVGKNKNQLLIDSDACIDCSACMKTCPMQLAPVEMKGGNRMKCSGDCLKCGLCVATCPKNALSF